MSNCILWWGLIPKIAIEPKFCLKYGSFIISILTVSFLKVKHPFLTMRFIDVVQKHGVMIIWVIVDKYVIDTLFEINITLWNNVLTT